MKTLRVVTMALVLGSAPALWAAEPLQAPAEPHQYFNTSSGFFMDKFSACPHCRTITIVVTDDTGKSELIEAFKSIAADWGKDHAGSVISRKEMLVNYRVFKDLGCRPVTGQTKNLVYYVDQDESYCEAIPYENDDGLASLISVISYELDSARAVRTETISLRLKRAVDEYAKDNRIVAASKEPLYHLIDTYITPRLKKLMIKE